jgi:hypothetical protein
MVAFQKRDAPGDNLAKRFVVCPLDPEFGPTTEMSFLDSGFLHRYGVNIIIEQAAHFGAQTELGPIHMLRFPFHCKARSASKFWFLAQAQLIGVPLIEAGRKRMTTMLVQKLGQDFDNTPLPRLEDGREQKQNRKRNEKPAHRQPV